MHVVYFDGVAVANHTNGQTDITDDLAHLGVFGGAPGKVEYLDFGGKVAVESGSKTQNTMNFGMDDFLIFDRALSGDEIAALKGTSLADYEDDSLSVKYTFETAGETQVENEAARAGGEYPMVFGVSGALDSSEVDVCSDITPLTAPILVSHSRDPSVSNEAPTGEFWEEFSASAVESKTVQMELIKYGFDADGDSIVVVVTALPTLGELYEINRLDPDVPVLITEADLPYTQQFHINDFEYMHAPTSPLDTSPFDEFTIKFSDGTDLSEALVARIGITYIDNVPVADTEAHAVAIELQEDADATNVEVHYSDYEDTGATTVLITKLPEHGTLTYTDPGTFVSVAVDTAFTQ